MCKDMPAKAIETRVSAVDDVIQPNEKAKTASKVFRMEDVLASQGEARKLIVIHDSVYDITDYIPQHPGSDIVLINMIGRDCTDTFECYHRENSVARKLFHTFKVGTLNQPLEVPAHVQAFRNLHQELIKQGIFDVQPLFYFKLKIWLVSLFVSSIYLTTMTASLVAHLCGAFLMGLFWQQFAGLGHDGGHSSVANNFLEDHSFGSTTGALLSGISTGWWKRNHNTHHVVPNSMESDPNIQHMPLFALTEKQLVEPYVSTYSNKKFGYDKLSRFLVSYQHYLFLPVMAVARFNLYAQSIRYLTKKQEGRTYYRTEELSCIAGFAVWFTALVLTLPAGERLSYVLLSHAVAGVLHVQIVLSHFSMEIYRDRQLVGKQVTNEISMDDDWYTIQLKTTLDVDCPPWADWVHIGLQFQTAHHIYPTLPRNRLREVTKLVEKVCEKQGLPYHHFDFWTAVMKTMQNLKETAYLARSGKYCAQDMLWEAMTLEG